MQRLDDITITCHRLMNVMIQLCIPYVNDVLPYFQESILENTFFYKINLEMTYSDPCYPFMEYLSSL